MSGILPKVPRKLHCEHQSLARVPALQRGYYQIRERGNIDGMRCQRRIAIVRLVL